MILSSRKFKTALSEKHRSFSCRKIISVLILLSVGASCFSPAAEAFSRGLAQKVRLIEQKAKLKKYEKSVAECEDLLRRRQKKKAVRCAQKLLKEDLATPHQSRLNKIASETQNVR